MADIAVRQSLLISDYGRIYVPLFPNPEDAIHSNRQWTGNLNNTVKANVDVDTSNLGTIKLRDSYSLTTVHKLLALSQNPCPAIEDLRLMDLHGQEQALLRPPGQWQAQSLNLVEHKNLLKGSLSFRKTGRKRNKILLNFFSR